MCYAYPQATREQARQDYLDRLDELQDEVQQQNNERETDRLRFEADQQRLEQDRRLDCLEAARTNEYMVC